MAQNGTTPHPLDRQDAEALIGVMAVLEGHLIAGDLDPLVVDRLSERLVGPDAGAAELRVVLWNLNKRLQYVLGEHDQAAAYVFSQAVPSAGAPVAVDGRSYDDETVRWEVSVRSTTLPLSAEFDLERARLLALAAQHGGRDGGWGSPPPLDLTP